MPENCLPRVLMIQTPCFVAVVLGTLLNFGIADRDSQCHPHLAVLYEGQCRSLYAPFVTVESGQSVNLTCAAAQNNSQPRPIEARWGALFANGTVIEDLAQQYLSTEVQINCTENINHCDANNQYFTLFLTNITEEFDKTKIRCRIHFNHLKNQTSCNDDYFPDSFVLLVQSPIATQPTPINTTADCRAESTTNPTFKATTEISGDNGSTSAAADLTTATVTDVPTTNNPTNEETAAVITTVLRSDPMLLTLALTAIICSFVSMVTTLAHCIMWMCCRKNANNHPNHHAQGAGAGVIENRRQYVAQENCNDQNLTMSL